MHSNADPFAVQAKQNKTYMAVGVSLLVIAILLGVGTSIFGLGRALGGAVTKGANPHSGAATPAKSDISPAILGAPQDSGPVTMDPNLVKKMPKHNLDWLKHLERIENKRRELANKQMAGVLTQLTMLQGVGASENVMKGLLQDDPDVETQTPADEISNQTRNQKNEWKDLIDDFDSLPPPTDCVPIRNAYAQCLGETSAMLSEVMAAITGAGEDPKNAVSNLMKLRGKSADRIDVAAKQTDDLVQDICDEYGVRKWFKVNADVSGGMSGVLSGLEGAIGH